MNLNSIIRQSKYWRLYGVISPIAFVMVASGVAGIHYANNNSIIFSSWVLLMTSAFIWWFWTIKVIVELTGAFQSIFDQVSGLRSDIKDVKTDIGNLNK